MYVTYICSFNLRVLPSPNPPAKKRKQRSDRGFKIAVSEDFFGDGSPPGSWATKFASFDLSPVAAVVELVRAPIDAATGAVKLAGLDADALILLGARFTKESFGDTADRTLRLVARFGVGYDTVDIEACTERGVAVSITPDGVRTPVAVGILTFILALSTRLLSKDIMAREGKPGFDKRGLCMGEGLVGKSMRLSTV